MYSQKDKWNVAWLGEMKQVSQIYFLFVQV